MKPHARMVYSPAALRAKRELVELAAKAYLAAKGTSSGPAVLALKDAVDDLARFITKMEETS